MKILFLTNNPDVTRPLYEWLRQAEGSESVTLWDEPLTKAMFQPGSPLAETEFIVSYSYLHMIRSDVFRLLPGKVINLHIAYLPWNRGADPNYWSFIDDTPKGVTIHLVDEGVDTGGILLQKGLLFDETSETFVSTYQALQDEIQSLFRENWTALKSGQIPAAKQSEAGNLHRRAELPGPLDWNENIAGYKARRKREL